MLAWGMLAWGLLAWGCKDEPTNDPPDSAPGVARSSHELSVATLRGFPGESHGVVGLPDGDCVAASSWFGDTDVGAGPLTNTTGKRQGLLVRYRPDGRVKWSQPISVWPFDLAFDGKSRVLVVGQPMDEATAFAVVGVADGAVQQRGLVDGYANAGTFTDGGRVLVLSTSQSRAGAHIDDVTDGGGRWPWSQPSNLVQDIESAPNGGAYVALPRVGDLHDGTVLYRIDRTGKEMWRRELCIGGMSAALASSPDGGLGVAACEPVQLFRIEPDGSVRSDGRVAARGGARVPRALAWVGTDLALAAQLLGEDEIAGHALATWDTVNGDERRGAGDALIVVHDGKKVTHFAHGHGLEADVAAGIAPGPDGSLWVVGNSRRSIDFGRGHTTSPDERGRATGFIARFTR